MDGWEGGWFTAQDALVSVPHSSADPRLIQESWHGDPLGEWAYSHIYPLAPAPGW